MSCTLELGLSQIKIKGIKSKQKMWHGRTIINNKNEDIYRESQV